MVGSVFIVGCPRSGTTLLQTMLNSSDDVISFPETHFFRGLTPSGFFRHVKEVANFNSNAWSKTVAVSKLLSKEYKINPPKRFLRRSSFAKQFFEILDGCARQAGVDSWIEKTPDHVFNINDIISYSKAAKFIHIIRDGDDTIASLFDVTNRYPSQWGGAWSVDKCANHWIQSVSISAKFHKLNIDPHRHKVVLYSSLVNTPELVLRDVCNFLAIDFNISMLESRALGSNKVIMNNEPWKSDVSGTIVPSFSKFEKVFSADDRCYILDRIKDSELTDYLSKDYSCK